MIVQYLATFNNQAPPKNNPQQYLVEILSVYDMIHVLKGYRKGKQRYNKFKLHTFYTSFNPENCIKQADLRCPTNQDNA